MYCEYLPLFVTVLSVKALAEPPAFCGPNAIAESTCNSLNACADPNGPFIGFCYDTCRTPQQTAECAVFLATEAPTAIPSTNPSSPPSSFPSLTPTLYPTQAPSGLPTKVPSTNPTSQPSAMPSESPTAFPSVNPSSSPSSIPTVIPSTQPSTTPSQAPSQGPTQTPSQDPSKHPSRAPSPSPSSIPTETPTAIPTVQPTSEPTMFLPQVVPYGTILTQNRLVAGRQTTFTNRHPLEVYGEVIISQGQYVAQHHINIHSSGILTVTDGATLEVRYNADLNDSTYGDGTVMNVDIGGVVNVLNGTLRVQGDGQSGGNSVYGHSLLHCVGTVIVGSGRQYSAAVTVMAASIWVPRPGIMDACYVSGGKFNESNISGIAMYFACPDTDSPSTSPSSSFPTYSPSSLPPTPVPSTLEPTVSPFTTLPPSTSSTTTSTYPHIFWGTPTVSPTNKPTAATTTQSTSESTTSSTLPAVIVWAAPTRGPSKAPTLSPTSPTFAPTAFPLTPSPTHLPSLSFPTNGPTQSPTIAPSVQPSSSDPTRSPTVAPATSGPTNPPTKGPSEIPTSVPSAVPSSSEPTTNPTSAPATSGPTFSPTVSLPTNFPSTIPTIQPTSNTPTRLPSFSPSMAPTQIPTNSPSDQPSHSPSAAPTTSLPTPLPYCQFPDQSLCSLYSCSVMSDRVKATCGMKCGLCRAYTSQPTGLPSVVPSSAPSATPTSNPMLEPASVNCEIATDSSLCDYYSCELMGPILIAQCPFKCGLCATTTTPPLSTDSIQHDSAECNDLNEVLCLGLADRCNEAGVQRDCPRLCDVCPTTSTTPDSYRTVDVGSDKLGGTAGTEDSDWSAVTFTISGVVVALIFVVCVGSIIYYKNSTNPKAVRLEKPIYGFRETTYKTNPVLALEGRGGADIDDLAWEQEDVGGKVPLRKPNRYSDQYRALASNLNSLDSTTTQETYLQAVQHHDRQHVTAERKNTATVKQHAIEKFDQNPGIRDAFVNFMMQLNMETPGHSDSDSSQPSSHPYQNQHTLNYKQETARRANSDASSATLRRNISPTAGSYVDIHPDSPSAKALKGILRAGEKSISPTGFRNSTGVQWTDHLNGRFPEMVAPDSSYIPAHKDRLSTMTSAAQSETTTEFTASELDFSERLYDNCALVMPGASTGDNVEPSPATRRPSGNI